MNSWEEYGVPPVVEVRASQQYGRGLYTRNSPLSVGVGLEVLKAEPYVHVLSNDVRGRFCDYCVTKSQSLLKCGGCKFVRYCSTSCQAKDWKWHKGECKGIAAVRPHMPTPLMRLVVRAMQRKAQEPAKALPEGKEFELDLLCSCSGSIDGSMEEEVATVMAGIRMLLRHADLGLMETAYSILCRALCNTFSIYSTELENIGAGLYIVPSLLNHSCVPNCAYVFEGSSLRIRTIKHIQSEGQLLISYSELLEGKAERAKALKRSYNFECVCSRCSTESSEDSLYKGMYAVVVNGEAKMSGTIAAGLDCIVAVSKLKKSGDFTEVVRTCEASLARQSPVLGPMHWLTTKTLRELFQACLESQDWSKAMSVGERLIRPYKEYLPPYHPVYGVHLMVLAKLHRLSGSLEHLKLSVKELTEAADQLAVVYGRKHSTTRDAQDMLEDSLREVHARETQSHT